MDRNHLVSYSVAEQVHTIRPVHINGFGRLFGGTLMQWIDELAGIVAKRHAGCQITTVAIDNLVFKKGAYENDLIYMNAKITFVGHTSMEIEVDTFVENYEGVRNLINRAFVVMVAIDKDGKPLEVPGLELVTEEEKISWDSGKKRYDLRKTRHREGF